MDGLIEDAWRIYRKFKDNIVVVKPSIPILFFGNTDAYFASPIKTITVGLNPSRVEFPNEDRFFRFDWARSISEQTSREEFRYGYHGTLKAYFRSNPYKQWFNSFEPVLRRAVPSGLLTQGIKKTIAELVVDTVFVVDHWCDHNETNFRQVLKGKVSDTYADATLSPCYREPVDESVKAAGCRKKRDLRLYFGATYQNPLDGMFSFVPCLPYEPNTNGFVRPVIKIEGATRDNLTQGYKLTPKTDLHGIKRLWDEVVQQVLDQELMLGVFTELPRKVSNVAAISIIDQHFAFKKDLDKC